MKTSSIIKQRVDKADSTKAFLNRNEEKKLHKIYIGNKDVQQLTVSPDERFITYTLFEKSNEQKTVVPSYVNKTGYTTDIPGRPKVGRPDGNYFFLFLIN